MVQAEKSREDARIKASGQFGTQPHRDSGIVTVDPIFTRSGGQLPTPLVDQDALAAKFGLDDDCDVDTYMAWQEAVRAELAPHLQTSMVLEQWWEFNNEPTDGTDPASQGLSASMIVTNDIGAPFLVTASSTLRPLTRDDKTSKVTYLTESDLRRNSPNEAGDGSFYLTPQPWDPMYAHFSDDPDRYAIEQRDQMVASGYAGTLLGDRKAEWDKFSKLCDDLQTFRDRTAYRVDVKTTVNTNFLPRRTPIQTASSMRFWAKSHTDALLAAAALNQAGLASTRPEDYFTQEGARL